MNFKFGVASLVFFPYGEKGGGRENQFPLVTIVKVQITRWGKR